MPISGKIQVNKLIQQINSQTQCLIFSKILQKIQQQHIFKYSLNPVCKICEVQTLNKFTQNCYRLVLLKLVAENKQNKWWGPQQIVDKSLRQTSANIKQNYCELLEAISEKKSQTMELVLFLIFFSLEIAFDLLFHNEKICMYFEDLFEKERHAIQSKACIWINYEITGVQIRPNVYRHLLKKYYDNLKTNRKEHIKSKTSSNLLNKKILQNSENLSKQKDNLEQSKQQKLKKMFQLNNELKLIFQKGSYTSKLRNNLKKKSLEKQNQNSLSFSEEHCRNKMFAQASLRNSNAFNEKRKVIYERKKLRQTQYNNFQKIRNRSENRKISKQFKEYKDKKGGMNLISVTFKYLFSKDLKKNPIQLSKKATIEDWENKLKKMHVEGEIQRVSLASSSKRLRKTISTDFDEEKMIQNLKQYNSDTINTFRSIKMLECQKRKLPRQGFCQFIDNREPKQIGIVKSIINFTNARDQPKNIKLSSKGFKEQYEQFNKKMIGHMENFFEDDNFTYRLQKVITGTNKF